MYTIEDEGYLGQWLEAINRELAAQDLQVNPTIERELIAVLDRANEFYPVIVNPSSSEGVVFLSGQGWGASKEARPTDRQDDFSLIVGEGQYDYDSTEAVVALGKAATILKENGLRFSVGVSGGGWIYLNIHVDDSRYVAPRVEEEEQEQPRPE